MIAAMVAVSLISCESKSPELGQIEEDISKSALGMDLDYKGGELVLDKQITVQDAYDFYYENAQIEADSLQGHAKRVADNAKDQNNTQQYHIWTYIHDRSERMSESDRNDIDFSVYKYTYSIKNPLLGDARRQLTNYYFFDHAGRLVDKLNESDMQGFHREFIQQENQPYEIAYGKMASGI